MELSPTNTKLLLTELACDLDWIHGQVTLIHMSITHPDKTSQSWTDPKKLVEDLRERADRAQNRLIGIVIDGEELPRVATH